MLQTPRKQFDHSKHHCQSYHLYRASCHDANGEIMWTSDVVRIGRRHDDECAFTGLDADTPCVVQHKRHSIGVPMLLSIIVFGHCRRPSIFPRAHWHTNAPIVVIRRLHGKSTCDESVGTYAVGSFRWRNLSTFLTSPQTRDVDRGSNEMPSWTRTR